METEPTLLGHVGAVSGSQISVKQSPSVASGISIIGGKSYRIGQVGSFVRIRQGYHDIYGLSRRQAQMPHRSLSQGLQ